MPSHAPLGIFLVAEFDIAHFVRWGEKPYRLLADAMDGSGSQEEKNFVNKFDKGDSSRFFHY
jgi:hypothetical protein